MAWTLHVCPECGEAFLHSKFCLHQDGAAVRCEPMSVVRETETVKGVKASLAECECSGCQNALDLYSEWHSG